MNILGYGKIFIRVDKIGNEKIRKKATDTLKSIKIHHVKNDG